MKIKFIIATEFPMINFGLFSWKYAEYSDSDIEGKNLDLSGVTIALGLIFFHIGISFYHKEYF